MRTPLILFVLAVLLPSVAQNFDELELSNKACENNYGLEYTAIIDGKYHTVCGDGTHFTVFN